MLPIQLKLPEHFLDTEIRDGYTVSTRMKKLWAVELDLLQEFDRVCQENGIQYYLCGGTLLGAVRHGGYIPWDDDIDIMLTREEYARLCICAPTAFCSPYFFQTEATDPGSMRGHAQLRNSRTTGMLRREAGGKNPYNQGIWIDIFPLDNVPDNMETCEHYMKKLMSRRYLLEMYRRRLGLDSVDNEITLKKALLRMLSPLVAGVNRIFHINACLYARYEKLLKTYENDNTKEFGILCLPTLSRHLVWNKTFFRGAPCMKKFEMLYLPVPPGYEDILTGAYGDWHQFVIGENQHGEIIFDTDKPYTCYLKTAYDRNTGGKICGK